MFFYKKSLEKILTRITGTLHEEQCTVMAVHRRFFFRMRIVSDMLWRKSIQNFISENCAVYGMMWKNVVEPDMPQITHKQCEIPLVFNCNNGYANAPECFIYIYIYTHTYVYIYIIHTYCWQHRRCFLPQAVHTV